MHPAWLLRAGLRGTQINLSIPHQYTAADGNSAAVASIAATCGGIACKLWHGGNDMQAK